MKDSPRPIYSVTSLLVYDACPWQYYYSFVLRVPPPVTPAMRRGTSVHKLIADRFRHPELVPTQLAPAVQRLLDNFTRSRFNLTPIATEKRFVIPFQRADVRGRIDVVLPHGRGLEIVDFKSGSGQGRDDLVHHLQLPLYALASRTLFDRPADALKYTYYFLSDSTEISFDASEPGFAGLTARVETLLSGIDEGQFEPGLGCTCHACRAREVGLRV